MISANIPPMSAPSAPTFPLFLYLYDPQGRYGSPTEITDAGSLEAAMRIMVRDHIGRRLEVRITNLADELVFHSQDGKILWPQEQESRKSADQPDWRGQG